MEKDAMSGSMRKPPVNYLIFLDRDTFDRLQEVLHPEDRITPAAEREVLRFWTISHGTIDFERATGEPVKPLT
jgi:hypothetical protein